MLFSFYSTSLFFCTLALFSSSYTGGGTAYTLYSLLLSIVIGVTVFMASVKKAFWQHKIKIPMTKLAIVFLFFYLLVCIIYGYFHYGTEISQKVLQYFLGFTAPAIFLALVIKEKDIETFYKSLKYLNVYLTGCVLIGFLRLEGSTQFDNIGGTTYLLIGYTMAALFSYNFINFINVKTVVGKLFFSFLMVINVSMIILSGARGATVSVVVVTICMYYLYIVKGRKVVRYTFVLAVVGCVGYLFLNQSEEYSTAWWRMSLLFEDDLGISSSGRDVFYQAAIEQFKDRPFVGNGIGAFANYFGYYIYPHNIVLEILSDFGVIGFIVAFFFMIRVVSNAIKMLKQNAHNQYMVFLFIQSLIMLSFSGSYLSELQFWIPFVLIFTAENKGNKDQISKNGDVQG